MTRKTREKYAIKTPITRQYAAKTRQKDVIRLLLSGKRRYVRAKQVAKRRYAAVLEWKECATLACFAYEITYSSMKF